MKLITLSIPLLLLFALGCGGGGGGSSSNSPGEPAGAEFAFGSLSGRAASTNPPKTTTSHYVAATALTGIITSLRLRDQELAEWEGRVVFLSRLTSLNSPNYDVFSCNLDGTELVQVTSTPGISEQGTTVSPDGKKIAFYAIGPGGDYEIYVMNIDGSNRVQLTDNAIDDFGPRWSPSSTSLTYYGNGNIYLVNVNSKVATQLTNDAFADETPEFTADGQDRCVFVGEQGR